MGESIHEILLKLGDVLHWLGKHREGNIMIWLARWAKVQRIETFEELTSHVEAREQADIRHNPGKGDANGN